MKTLLFALAIAILGNWLLGNQRRSAPAKPGSATLPVRFGSISELHQAAQQGVSIDVNQATLEDWLRLPGLSAYQAQTLVQLARAGVSFHCLEDLAAALDLPPREIQPLAPILHFAYYEPGADLTPLRLNPNTATICHLQQVPAITPQLAEQIVHDRIMQGPYFSLVDFQRRLHLPGSLTNELMHYLTFR